MLNPSQVRAMSVALQLTEEAMDRIERLLVAPVAGVMYSLVDDLTREERKRIPALCGQVRAALEDASARVQAETLERSRRREIRGEAATLWATLEDTTSKGLRGYGPLAPEDAAVADALLEEISRHVVAIFRLVEAAPGAEAGDPPPAAEVGPARRW